MDENRNVEMEEVKESKLKTFGGKVWNVVKRHGKTVLIFTAGVAVGILGSKFSSNCENDSEVVFVDEEVSEEDLAE